MEIKKNTLIGGREAYIYTFAAQPVIPTLPRGRLKHKVQL